LGQWEDQSFMGWLKFAWLTRRRAARQHGGDTRHANGHVSAPAPAGDDERATAPGIVMYGTPWCGDCRRAKRVFADLAVAYAYVDIEDDAEAAALVMRVNGGMRTVPTIIFPDGSVLVEPGRTELTEKLAAYSA
jgi:mycoredoxin